MTHRIHEHLLQTLGLPPPRYICEECGQTPFVQGWYFCQHHQSLAVREAVWAELVGPTINGQPMGLCEKSDGELPLLKILSEFEPKNGWYTLAGVSLKQNYALLDVYTTRRPNWIQ